MNVTSIYPGFNQIGLPGAIGGTTPTTVADANGSRDASGGASATVSPFAQLLSQLQQLQQTNPGEAKTVLSDIANKLQSTAQQDGGSAGRIIGNLASQFQQAAQTGDISSIRPHHHGHHHHHGAAGYPQPASGTTPAQAAAGLTGIATPGTDVRNQVDDVIGQVLTQDLGTVGS
jgi:hypothetical protein